ncbi:conserved Plasmodium protein, unknown function [Plasmodium gallinaceum]|uniref:Uncharacterized protein n=1 Tax=Plasmodium gallinaceum TaxID=5849 RepID=A0A1J1GP59_PLAGA|nr:conserved Plasmodium protein, unknown function [Plasmodium gallinaceum]CRG94279.1 conserved Plasmodium protein, unknown function [Plasmodium gallinaceum]
MFLIISFHESIFADNSNKNLTKKKNYNEENYFNREDVYYITEDKKKSTNYDDLSENTKNNLIDYNDIEKINNLKNLKISNSFQNLQKSYYENSLNDGKLNKQIKKILSLALNIPINEINLHDINLLLKKWRKINKIKNNSNKISNNDYYFKKIKKHKVYSSNNNKDKIIRLQTNSEEKNKNNIINVDYLMELIY